MIVTCPIQEQVVIIEMTANLKSNIQQNSDLASLVVFQSQHKVMVSFFSYSLIILGVGIQIKSFYGDIFAP
jgi:hypothetical protein